MLRPRPGTKPGPGLAVALVVQGSRAEYEMYGRSFYIEPFIALRPCLILRFASLVVQPLYALVANSSMHRLRLSSEGPEVVSQIPDKFFVPYTNRSPRSALYQKQLEVKGEIPLFPLPLIREPSRFEEEEQNRYCGGRSCSLVTVLLIIVAFLLGGGIGGGIGGAFIVKDKAKISR